VNVANGEPLRKINYCKLNECMKIIKAYIDKNVVIHEDFSNDSIILDIFRLGKVFLSLVL
jgi:hypothetical protein